METTTPRTAALAALAAAGIKEVHPALFACSTCGDTFSNLKWSELEAVARAHVHADRDICGECDEPIVGGWVVTTVRGSKFHARCSPWVMADDDEEDS